MKLEKLFFEFCDWSWRFMKLNFLWMTFTILGGIVFGIMPATVATFYIMRKWMQQELETPMFTTFKEVYKKEFINTNKCGLVFMAIFIFLAIDLNILYNMDAMYSTVLYMVVMAVLFFVSIAFMYFFPTYVHFDLSIKGYIKNSFILSLISPKQTILMIVGLIGTSYFIKSNPGLIPFFSVAVPSYWIMNVAYKRFLKV